MPLQLPTDKGPALIREDGSTVLPGTLAVAGDATFAGGATFAGDADVAGALTVTGSLSATGGAAPAVAVSARLVHTGGVTIMAAADGNDTTPSATETYISEIFVPCNMTITGIAVFNGSVAGTDKLCAHLYDASGAPVAQSAAAGVTATGVDSFQRLPLTTPYAAKGPATYYVGCQANGTTTRLNTHVVGNFAAQKKTGETFGAATALTIDGTFTTAVGIIASLY